MSNTGADAAASAQEVVLGIDIGGTKVALALVTTAGVLVAKRRCPLEALRTGLFFEALFQQMDAFFMEQAGGYRLKGIGIGLKGTIAPDQATIVSSSVLHEDLPFDLHGAVTSRYGVPCRIDNDVHAATLAELCFGIRQTDFLYMNVGTGLAVGMVSGGHLVRGAYNAAGEVGNCVFPRADAAEKHFILEHLVSGRGLHMEALRLHRAYPDTPLARRCQAGPESVTGHDVMAASQTGDRLALAVMDHFTEALCWTLINLCQLLNPSTVVIGGGVIGEGALLPTLTDRVQRLCDQYELRHTAGIVPSILGGDDVGVLGAASLLLV